MAVNDSMAAIESSGSSNLHSDANPLASASSLKNRPRTIPSRCGSAPPNFEEAFAAIRNPMLKQQSSVKNVDKGVLDRAAEERLLTDPEYIAYYNAHVNLNPRLPPPLLSRESRHLVGRKVCLSYARKLDSCDDNEDLNIKPRLLPTHQEDIEDDILMQQQALEDQTQFLIQDINDHTTAPGAVDPPSTPFPLGKSDGSQDIMAAHDSTNSTINMSSASMPEHVGRKHEDMLLFEAYGLPLHQMQRFQPQFAPQGVSGSYSGMTMFPGAYPNISMMKPVMHNPGLVPAPYASSAPYMTGNQFGPRLQTLSNFGSLPPGFYPPYFGGYMSRNMFTQTVDPFVGRALFNRATTLQPHFTNPIQGQYFQHSFMDGIGRDSAQSSQYDNFLAQKESNLAAFMYHDHMNLSNGNPSSSDLYMGQKGHRGSNDVEDTKRHAYLEALKFGGGAKLDLSDIAGKVVEFSTDQHGSRFIQQKLEVCIIQEKEFVFTELLPHASQLMTDVYGNYVVQKLFEHGTSDHRRQLADQIIGQMLTLSLQMYGCRVIQKALEVIELDQKTLLARELDGHVRKCVHDQNGNHVIQKCIEHIPAEKIGFIISAFHGEVASLSVHPYGCRVIQRVLEHFPDTSATQFVMDEILESACMLAHDQYGNYVIQHVLELGKPHERSQVIDKLGGKFVEMSQHKYASNVIEKCLVYGDASAQESLIREIVGRPQEDANLAIMMKDQYANYVIQRILEICKDEEKNILMKCIAGNVQSLKQYTYGKHIVARYEQLLSVNQEQTTG